MLASRATLVNSTRGPPVKLVVVAAGRVLHSESTTSGFSSVWYERCVRDAEAAGSNPASPTRTTVF